MRLLNVKTRQLEDPVYPSADWPEYTILSHTWGEEEVSFQDLTSGSAPGLTCYEKLEKCCAKSMAEGFERTWIDTCCIDKSSSAELSEAINSMFTWYSRAQVCYAYLSDVEGPGFDHAGQPSSSSFRKSRWFGRGWTLQELLAPAEVVFLNKDWVEIGTKTSLASVISEITRIAVGALSKPLCGSETVAHVCHGYSVAQKMSWAASREATREEDRAYSLLGLFGVNMPLLYGEGGEKAFIRLQQEIMRQSSDDSIFAWSTLGCENWISHRLSKEMHRSGLGAWRPELFYSGFTVHTPAAAERFRHMQRPKWTEGTCAHTSTAYDEDKHFVSLNAPILSSESHFHHMDIFKIFESSAPDPARDKILRYSKLDGPSMAWLFFRNPTTVIAILSCCFEFGRVGIVLEKREDGTYCRVHQPSIVGVQVTELPRPQVLKIRHRIGVGDVCTPQITLYEWANIEVVLSEEGGYSAAETCFKPSDKIIKFGNWNAAHKHNRVSLYPLDYMGRVALVYHYQGEDSAGHPDFVLALRWEANSRNPLGIIGITVRDNEVTDEHWVEELSWESRWRKPETTWFPLESGRVDVNIRKAPGDMEGLRWYIYLSFRPTATTATMSIEAVTPSLLTSRLENLWAEEDDDTD